MRYMGVYFPRREEVDRVVPPLVRVTVNGRWRTGLRVVRVEQRVGGAPRVRLELDVGRSARGGPQWLPEAALLAIKPDDLVRVEIVRGGRADWRGLSALVLVEGMIEGPAFNYDAADEGAGFDVLDRSAMILDQHVSGQRHLLGTQVVPLKGLELTFNMNGRGNRLAEAVSIEGRPRYVFTAADSGDADDAEYWTAAQAAEYLVNTDRKSVV